MAQDEQLPINKIIVLAVVAALFGGGGTSLLFKSPNGQDAEASAAIANLADIVAKLSKEPSSRPDPYTGTQGDRDRASSERTDQLLQHQIDELKERQKELNANYVRQWTAIRNHIETLAHPGSAQRMDGIESQIEDLKARN